MRGRFQWCWSIAGLTVVCALLGAAPAVAFDPQVEAQNFSKGQERGAIYHTPEYQLLLRQISAQNQAAATAMQATDPERQFTTDLCGNGMDGCAGDVRLYDWGPKGYGIVKPVLFTARNGATLSGRVWATRSGPAKRPGIVITNGSVQADEQLYWFAAQTLAKAGYVVLTWDPQGQGQSDTQGAMPDQNEGTPAQSDGRPFYDGTVDAVNFFFSTPSRPYQPVKSCSSGTSHADKQSRRVAAGRNAAYNPLSEMLDQSRVGLAGHSYGAAGVSYVAQADPRIKAVVAWDNLGGTNPNKGNGIGGEEPCPADPSARAVPKITKPGLGISGDYFLPPTPNTSDPDPLAKSTHSLDYSKAGVDTGELIIRGGTHLDFDFIPNDGFPATLRGADFIAWYTTAWFDKYVKGDASADSRLLTNRWNADRPEAAVDPKGDGNMFSFYYPSRLDVRVAGKRFQSANLRSGNGLAADCEPVPFSYVDVARSPDTPRTARPCRVAVAGGRGGTVTRCLPRRLAVSHRGIGPARLGSSYKRFHRRYRAVKRGKHVTRFCVRGGGRFLVSARRDKIDLVASTARGHRTRHTGPGRGLRRPRLVGARRVRPGLYVGHIAGGGRVIYGTRKNRVSFLATVPRRQAVKPKSLARRLHAVGLR
ncbi:MAG: alpha/beta hydrolase [Thermoleophilaceae bacterium]